jgi:hypothetical protein
MPRTSGLDELAKGELGGPQAAAQSARSGPDRVSYRKKIADAGNVHRQECKIIRWTKFSPM